MEEADGNQLLALPQETSYHNPCVVVHKTSKSSCKILHCSLKIYTPCIRTDSHEYELEMSILRYNKNVATKNTFTL